MFRLRARGTSCPVRKTKTQKQKRLISLFAVVILGITASIFAFNVLADIIEDNDVRVDTDADLTYYLSVKEDGIDAEGTESNDYQTANLAGGRVSVTDRIPDGLEFQGFVTTSDGTFGAVSRSDPATQCSGRVVDDTEEESVDSGTWNAGHTEYFYHGLHYNANTRTVSFMVEKVKAGCELIIGIITKTPATVDDPNTPDVVETRRDFFNTAFAAEKDVTAISNTVHAYIGSSITRTYNVTYRYTGDVPSGAPEAPGRQSYSANNEVSVSTSPTRQGYTFSGWTTSDVTVTDGGFTMPAQNVEFVGVWVQNMPTPEYDVTYVVNGVKPTDFMPPAQRSYEADTDVTIDSTPKNANIDGYRFSGWTTTDATLSETGFTMPTRNVTLVGSFERISYQVCYEFEGVDIPPNADELLPACETHYPGDTVNTADDPDTSGYDFVGWYKNSSFTMPDEDIVIMGEWSKAAGKFAPEITKTITDAKDKYIYGETVWFKITVHNTAEYAITDVYLQEELEGAVFTAPQALPYVLKTPTIAVIPTIPAGGSVDVYAKYKVTDNVAQTLTNTVELTGAIAEDSTLDTEQDYIATVDFNTVPEPVPFTGIIFNALPYIGLIVLGAGIIIFLVISSKKFDIVNRIRARRINSNQTLRLAMPAFLIVGLVIGVIIAKNVSADNYTEVIRSIELTSQHTSFADDKAGAWNITKSAEWTEEGKARITFNVDTKSKIRDGNYSDIILVIDNSGSMGGAKLNQVKADAIDLIGSVLSNTNNRIALVSFESTARKLSSFSNDKTNLVNLVNSLNATGCTNYYDGLKKAEEVLQGYNRQDNRELIMLFLTDGYPNEDTPNQNAQYQMLKQMYPYMIVNGIQYEMGDDVLDPIKRVSDNQYIANINSLNNVLFDASTTPYSYEHFTLTDYINDNFWNVEGISSIEASIGETSLSYDGNTPVVTWTMDDILRSGKSAKLTIDISLKDSGVITENTFLPTNRHETVQSVLPDTPNENIDSTSTPVLKSSYDVVYEPNLPSGCASYTGVLPETQNYLMYATVEKSHNTLSCYGYNFVGWEIAEGDPKIINDDYFKILSNDVTLRAVWSIVSISKAMDGEVVEEALATLDTGNNINIALKKLSGQTGSVSTSTNNTLIKAFISADSMSAAQRENAVTISSPDSTEDIYAWYENNTVYVYTDAPGIKGNTDMRSLFNSMRNLESIDAVENWEMSETQNMSSMFYGTTKLTNIDATSNWNTSSLTNVSAMFREATGIVSVSAISNWDMSNLDNISYAFTNATSLASLEGLEHWNVSRINTFSQLFMNCKSITSLEPLVNWNTSRAEYMNAMFNNTSSVTSLDGIENFNIPRVKTIDSMFQGMTNLTDIDALAEWEIPSTLTDMDSLFSGDSSLTSIEAIRNWNVSKVQTMNYMFSNTSGLTSLAPLEHWDVSSARYMNHVFYKCSGITSLEPLSGWNTAAATDMSYIFSQMTGLTSLDGIENLNISKVTTMEGMFQGDSGITDIDAVADWDISPTTKTMKYMFAGVTSLPSLNALSEWDVSKVNNFSGMFYSYQILPAYTNLNALADWDLSGATDLSAMFRGAGNLVDISAIADWDVSNVTDFNGMFQTNTSLSSLAPLSGWNLSSANDISAMFYGDTNITSFNSLSNWNVSNVTSMSSVFDGTGASSLNGLERWNVSNVTNMSYVFSDMSNLTNIDAIAGWNTSNVTSMGNMFNKTNMSSLDALRNWNVSSVSYMRNIFSNNPSLQSVDGLADWDVSNVTNMREAFMNDSGITSLEALNNWTPTSLTDRNNIFFGIPNTVTRPTWYTGG